MWLLRELYLSLLTDYPNLSREEIVSKRDEIQLRVAEVYNTAQLTDAKSYSLAQKALKENEAQFFYKTRVKSNSTRVIENDIDG